MTATTMWPRRSRRAPAGAVVDRQYQVPEAFPANKILLRVENTHEALKDLAADVRRQWRGSLVGITGSMGKTTTKEFMAQVLQTEFSVYRSPGNYNNLFGLPLAIFGLSPEDHIGIFEMGMSAPGEIAEMCRIAMPDVGVITNVAPVHLEFFESLKAIARAKGELAEGLGAGGTLIYNADDPLVCEIADGFDGDKISFGMRPGADIRAEEITIAGLTETRFRLICEGVSRRAMIPLCGAHYVMNALPAVALACRYSIDIEQIVESLRHLHQAHMRGQILHFREGFTVIDDSYNSNPRALMQMIETLSRVPALLPGASWWREKCWNWGRTRHPGTASAAGMPRRAASTSWSACRGRRAKSLAAQSPQECPTARSASSRRSIRRSITFIARCSREISC